MARKRTTSCYLVHDNGGRPFQVRVDAGAQRFWVLKQALGNDDDEARYEETVVLPTEYARAFVGKSPKCPMTRFSGGHGRRFDGNSMLFELGPLRYMHIGESVRTFEARAPITEFVSPVGNSDVPYPYAVDTEGTAYLITEDIALVGYTRAALGTDPYEVYYRERLLTPDRSFSPPREPLAGPFEGITDFEIGSRRYTFGYSAAPPGPEYDRLCTLHGQKEDLHVTIDGKRHKLTKAAYAGLMRRVALARGFEPMACTTVVPRMW